MKQIGLWRRGNLHPIAATGQEAIHCYFPVNPKACTRVIATINAEGEKLPLWSLCRGKISACERKFNSERADEIRSGWLKMAHQKNGWCDKTNAMQYLEWLRE
jgi:hypothetical protein